jgi:hypothetical protein
VFLAKSTELLRYVLPFYRNHNQYQNKSLSLDVLVFIGAVPNYFQKEVGRNANRLKIFKNGKMPILKVKPNSA